MQPYVQPASELLSLHLAAPGWYGKTSMKTIPYLIITLLVVGCSSEPVDSSRLVERNGITYLIAEDGTSKKPCTGKMSKHYENGQLEIKVTYKDGKRDGPWEYYYDNGQLDRKILFKNGKQID